MSVNENNFFYILVAASAVGKSALMRQMVKDELWIGIPKYSTRDIRLKDGEVDDVVQIDDSCAKDLCEQEAIKLRQERISLIKKLCGGNKGVVYYKNNNFYAVKIQDILDKLKVNNVVAIISDFHAIKILKNDSTLKNKIRVLYIASTIDERELLRRFKSREAITFDTDSESKKKAIRNIQSLCSVLGSATRLNYMDRIEEVMPLLNEEWNNILPYFETIKTRGANIRMLYNQYIENIALIDYAILNFYDLEYMYTQTRNIIHNAQKKREIKRPPVFMVCAAPSSGKATLMEIVGDLGEVNGNIRITHKYAKRAPRVRTDGRDGMIAIGEDGKFSDYISDRNNIWEWSFHKNGAETGGTKYAVNLGEINENIADGVAQIFISNMSQINVAKNLYPDNMVILYLHATHETETKNHITEKCRLDLLKKIAIDSNCTEAEALEMLNHRESLQNHLKNDIEVRLQEIKQVHDDFLSHNVQIDHILLNTGTREDLVAQMTNIINFYI